MAVPGGSAALGRAGRPDGLVGLAALKGDAAGLHPHRPPSPSPPGDLEWESRASAPKALDGPRLHHPLGVAHPPRNPPARPRAERGDPDPADHPTPQPRPSKELAAIAAPSELTSSAQSLPLLRATLSPSDFSSHPRAARSTSESLRGTSHSPARETGSHASCWRPDSSGRQHGAIS